MDLLDAGLDSSQDKDDENPVHLVVEGDDEENAALAGVAQGLSLDSGVQYQIRTDTSQGAVTYRVVQVPDGIDTGDLGSTSGFTTGGLQTSFNTSPGPMDLNNDSKLTYVSSITGNEGLGGSSNDLSGTVANLSNSGQLYVMMSPQDVLQGQRAIAPRSMGMQRLEGSRGGRDEKRRATHNEVERRRRDKINNWIVQLSKLIPDCSDMKQVGVAKSKGGILAKACDYITSLRSTISRLQDSRTELDMLQHQYEEVKQDNQTLRRLLHRHGIDIPPELGT